MKRFLWIGLLLIFCTSAQAKEKFRLEGDALNNVVAKCNQVMHDIYEDLVAMKPDYAELKNIHLEKGEGGCF